MGCPVLAELAELASASELAPLAAGEELTGGAHGSSWSSWAARLRSPSTSPARAVSAVQPGVGLALYCVAASAGMPNPYEL